MKLNSTQAMTRQSRIRTAEKRAKMRSDRSAGQSGEVVRPLQLVDCCSGGRTAAMMRALLLAAGSSLAYAQCGPPSETCGLYFAEVRPSLPIAELQGSSCPPHGLAARPALVGLLTACARAAGGRRLLAQQVPRACPPAPVSASLPPLRPACAARSPWLRSRRRLL